MRRNEGQAAAEFALMLPFLALLVLGLVDFGRVMAQYIAAANAAREAARYCTLYPAPPTEAVSDARNRLIHRVIDSRVNQTPTPAVNPTPTPRPQIAELGGRFPLADVQVRIQTTNPDGTLNPVVDYCPGTLFGMEVKAWVIIAFSPLTPIVERFFPQNPLPVGATAQMRVHATPSP